jgi:pimeloyl-ACP methyl ester carboxylesterase
MKKVKSSDGTLIAYEKTGEGPPMVLVHGGTTDHTIWKLVLPMLAKHLQLMQSTAADAVKAATLPITGLNWNSKTL